MHCMHPGMSQVTACLWNHLDVLHGRALKGALLFVCATKNSRGILWMCRSPQNVGMHAVVWHAFWNTAGCDMFMESPWCLAWQGTQWCFKLALCACHKGLQKHSIDMSQLTEYQDVCSGSLSCPRATQEEVFLLMLMSLVP